jgi:para-nitrobenzyl esterase
MKTYTNTSQTRDRSAVSPFSPSLNFRRPHSLTISLLAAASLITLTSVVAKAAEGPVVKTANGKVEGFIQNNVAEFLGIPYAAPPVGKLRWQPPQPAASWGGIRQATTYANRCAQVTTLGVFSGPAENNEDCLYVNVFSPNLQNTANLPVIVWIHGGGNLDGESNDYDGSKMATQGNTVVVTLNYRLNLMGFLAVASLDSEGHNFGNYGLLDQQAVLNWVRTNIANFGGDPNNVTVGGQSAGAEDTGFAMLSPLAAGTFQRGICESFCPTGNIPTLAAAESIGEQFATAAGCGGSTGAAQANCLRNVPASEIEALAGTDSAASAYVLGPMLDGTVLPIQPPTAWASGKFTHLPLMNGNVQDEENFGLAIDEYFSSPRQPPTPAQYTSYVANTYASPPYPAGTAQKVLTLYPLANYPSAQLAWDRAGTDPGICAEMQLNKVLAPQIPVYAYLFNDQTPPFYFPNMPGFTPDAYHTSDIQFLFPLYHGGQGTPHPLIGAQATLSNELVAAWTKFAWTGNPNGVGNAPWPVFKSNPSAQDVFLENVPALSTESTAQFESSHHCVFWASLAH